jgi:putative hydrolase of the HAD superfamily
MTGQGMDAEGAGQADTARALRLAEIDTWIFDLDNTLYPASSGLFNQISQRMGAFVSRTLAIDLAAAHVVQKQLFLEHGTTMRGLMLLHGVDPHVFMEDVHDIDLTVLEPALLLDRALAALPGRKLIHTNASVPYAEKVLARLGVERHFSGIFDIAAAEWQPKPEPTGYETLRRRFGVDPARAAMVEDMAVNLRPAAEAGMTTLWVETPNTWASAVGHEAHIHHRTADLPTWLAGVVEAAAQRA